jgi:hypothetical protein
MYRNLTLIADDMPPKKNIKQRMDQLKKKENMSENWSK